MNPLSPYFRERYSLCHLSDLNLYASSVIVLSFGSFVWVPSLSIIRMVSSIYLTRRSAQIFISLRRFLLHCLVSRSFLFFWGTLVLLFRLSPLLWWWSLLIFQSTCNFPSLQAFLFFFGSALLFLVIHLFPIFIMNMAYFPMPNSIPIWLMLLLLSWVWH